MENSKRDYEVDSNLERCNVNGTIAVLIKGFNKIRHILDFDCSGIARPLSRAIPAAYFNFSLNSYSRTQPTYATYANDTCTSSYSA